MKHKLYTYGFFVYSCVYGKEKNESTFSFDLMEKSILTQQKKYTNENADVLWCQRTTHTFDI